MKRATFCSVQPGRGCCWSTRGQASSWWIWVQTRPPYTTHIMAGTTQSSSVSARRISSCQLILIASEPWSKKGKMNHTDGLLLSMGLLITCVLHTITASEDTLRPSTSCPMLVCSSGTMATHSSWRPRELVSNLTLYHHYYSVHVRPIKRLVFLVFTGAEVEKVGGGATEFRYPSYVQHIMGWDIFLFIQSSFDPVIELVELNCDLSPPAFATGTFSLWALAHFAGCAHPASPKILQ